MDEMPRRMNHNRRLARVLPSGFGWDYAFALGLTVAAWMFFALAGSMPFYRGPAPLAYPVPIAYQVPIIFVYGLLIADLRHLAWPPRLTLAPALAVIALLSAARLLWLIPVSGHSLILGCAIPHFIARRRPFALAITLLLLSQVLYFKLFVWLDYQTWVVGLMLGLVFWLPTGFWLRKGATTAA